MEIHIEAPREISGGFSTVPHKEGKFFNAAFRLCSDGSFLPIILPRSGHIQQKEARVPFGGIDKVTNKDFHDETQIFSQSKFLCFFTLERSTRNEK